MIEVRELSKRFGAVRAVDNISFTVQPGRVTGFLGPNGAGKTTTLRMILALDTPTHGQALIDGRPYPSLEDPLREVGALLDAAAVQGGRRARDHLAWLAASNGLSRARIEQVLAITGLEAIARRAIRGFSLGMRQRLGIAAALLGDPPILLLDEPLNGLDPEGVVWLRRLLKSLAAEGRTVLVSSHLMSEMALTADHVIVLGGGHVMADQPLVEFISASELGQQASLEDAYLKLTDDAVTYRSEETR